MRFPGRPAGRPAGSDAIASRPRFVEGNPFHQGADAVVVPLGQWPAHLGPAPAGLEAALADAPPLRPGQSVATDGAGTGADHLIHVAMPGPEGMAGAYVAALYLARAIGAGLVAIPMPGEGDAAALQAVSDGIADGMRMPGCPKVVLVAPGPTLQ